MKNEIFYGNPIALNWKADDGAAATVRVQLSPFGEFTLRDGGKRSGTVQHCTRAAFEAMVANWQAQGAPDVLVDVDHASATGGSTEAAAWAKNLRVEDDGLCADFDLTPKGRELLEGRSYRFVSPGWTLADDGTPLALCSVALTNRPNLPVKPVVNADFDESKHPRAEDGKFSSGGGGGGGNDRPDGGFKAEKDRQSIASQAAQTISRISRLDRAGRAREINDGLQMFRGRLRGQRHDHWNRLEEYESVRAQHRAAIYLGLKYNRATHQYE